MNHKYIIKVLEDSIQKCSNRELQAKYNRIPVSVKKERLDGKLNPLEERDYDNLVEEIRFWEEDIGFDNMSPDQVKDVEDMRNRLFQYDKRMDNGYSLERKRDDAPVYSLSDFKGDSFTGMYDENLGVLEQEQINYQNSTLNISSDGRDSLRAYFGNDYAHINGELDPNYRGGYWDSLNSEQRREYHKSNEKIIPEIDKVMRDSKGLETSTVLYHGARDSHIVDIHTRVGDRIVFKGYVSTSYNQHVGEGYGSYSMMVRFLAPRDTKGVCANSGGLTGEVGEHEYLLSRRNRGSVVDIDYGHNPPVVTVLLD